MRMLLILLMALAGSMGPAQPSSAQGPAQFSNPIIAGFSPDPTIVRRGEDFYLVTSSFEYLPGLPVYHSRDLVNWELIGHALPEAGPLDLATVGSSGGIHAATIRYHDGTFYIASTNVADGKLVSFITTASDPAGPWSVPVIVEEAVGIDPALFFDDDGRVWYLANRVPEQPAFPGQALIWMQELDPQTLQLKGERIDLWSGCCQGVWAEGPRLYKKDGIYYLLIAEGGTSFEHAVSMAASKSVTGPYEGTPRNPLLTHRHLSFDHPITGVGHADLVELADGRWMGVALGWRLLDGQHGILGRETFLFDVRWECEREWWRTEKRCFPVMSPDSGKIELQDRAPFGVRSEAKTPFLEEFDSATLGAEWNARRVPPTSVSRLGQPQGWLSLPAGEAAIGMDRAYSFVGIRQRDLGYQARTRIDFAPTAKEEAGLVVMMNDRSAIGLMVVRGTPANALALVRWTARGREVIASVETQGGVQDLRVSGRGLTLEFAYRTPDGDWHSIGGSIDATFLSPAVIEGYNYTGLYVGLYASANGAVSPNQARFDHFHYQPMP